MHDLVKIVLLCLGTWFGLCVVWFVIFGVIVTNVQKKRNKSYEEYKRRKDKEFKDRMRETQEWINRLR